MRTTFNRVKAASVFTRSSAIVSYSRQDLTKKWVQRIQSKVNDSASVESFAKLSSLVDYYNKPAKAFKDDIDWDHWKEEIRTAGVVDKIQAKYKNFKQQNYNVDLVAQKSTVNSEKYDIHGLFLKWNYSLWMRQYMDNINSLISMDSLGDIQYVSSYELYNYAPGIRDITAGWRETGHYIRTSHYYENSISTIIRRQFRYSNRSWMPYWHSVAAWERGIQVKHVLMSL